MHTIEIPDNNKVITIPSHWDECTPVQLAYILQRAFEVVSGTIDINAFRVLVFAKLTGFQPNARYNFTKRIASSSELPSNRPVTTPPNMLSPAPTLLTVSTSGATNR